LEKKKNLEIAREMIFTKSHFLLALIKGALPPQHPNIDTLTRMISFVNPNLFTNSIILPSLPAGRLLLNNAERTQVQ